MKKNDQLFPLDWLVLPLIGILILGLAWQILSFATLHKGPNDVIVADIPSPYQTLQSSWLYIAHPFEKRGEMDMGILAFTWLSLKLVAKGYSIALLLGTPLGFLLGTSKVFTKMFDPVIQLIRPVSPLAWLPLGRIDLHRDQTLLSRPRRPRVGLDFHHRALRHVAHRS